MGSDRNMMNMIYDELERPHDTGMMNSCIRDPNMGV
jgi:hypothetical protein